MKKNYFRRLAVCIISLLIVSSLLVGAFASKATDLFGSRQIVNVEYNTVSPTYKIGIGKELGIILVPPDGHVDMDISIGSEVGELQFEYYDKNGNVVWKSLKDGVTTKKGWVNSGEVMKKFWGSNVCYVLVYAIDQWQTDKKGNSEKIKTCKFWYQGASQRRCDY